LEGEDVTSYHQVIRQLAPVIGGYLRKAEKQTVEQFCGLVNDMIASGGQPENSISTCLLEHAVLLKVRDLIRPI